MPVYDIRRLEKEDAPRLIEIEQELLGARSPGRMEPEYLRLCCELFNDTCFVACYGRRHIGFSLAFLREGAGYFTTLVVRPYFHGSRVASDLVQTTLEAVFGDVERCWVTVKEPGASRRCLEEALRALGVPAEGPDAGGPRLVTKLSLGASATNAY